MKSTALLTLPLFASLVSGHGGIYNYTIGDTHYVG